MAPSILLPTGTPPPSLAARSACREGRAEADRRAACSGASPTPAPCCPAPAPPEPSSAVPLRRTLGWAAAPVTSPAHHRPAGLVAPAPRRPSVCGLRRTRGRCGLVTPPGRRRGPGPHSIRFPRDTTLSPCALQRTARPHAAYHPPRPSVTQPLPHLLAHALISAPFPSGAWPFPARPVKGGRAGHPVKGKPRESPSEIGVWLGAYSWASWYGLG